MQKTYFHNRQLTDEGKSQKKLLPFSKIKKKKVVDINILLNKVKIEQKNQIKKKLFFLV